MKLLLLGPTGSGKGTQSQLLLKELQIAHISTGDILRNEIAKGSQLGLKAKSIMDAGQLMQDDIIIAIVLERVKAPDCKRGFLLDGFPRTIAQAKALLEAGLKMDLVINLEVPDDEIVARLSGRLVHPASGRVYHRKLHPPKKPNCDDETGEPLIQREDDNEPNIRKRLAVFHSQTTLVINYYKERKAQFGEPEFMAINGCLPAPIIFEQIKTALSQLETEKALQSSLLSSTKALLPGFQNHVSGEGASGLTFSSAAHVDKPSSSRIAFAP